MGKIRRGGDGEVVDAEVAGPVAATGAVAGDLLENGIRVGDGDCMGVCGAVAGGGGGRLCHLRVGLSGSIARAMIGFRCLRFTEELRIGIDSSCFQVELPDQRGGLISH